ncbi:Virulence-associated protein [Devosia sp. H5989]|nr:Virulence-associated protein [Devosia sp. H5989]
MAFEHPSGLPFAFLRARGQRGLQGVTFYGRRPFIQGGELNDLQEIARARQERLGRLIANNGDRVVGGLALVDRDAGTVVLTDGEIYIAGDVFPVEQATLGDVPMAGRVEIGVRLVRTYVTGEDDPTLLGLVPGSLAEGELGAARESVSIAWAREGDDGAGEFYQVYVLQDGTILDQTPPPLLDGIAQALAVYDRPNGHYIVKGCRVTALGPNAGNQLFSIEEGEANIFGFKVTRYSALRHAEPEDWDVAAVPGETHTYAGGATQTVTVDKFPIDEITTILLTKQKTVTLTRGALANGIDGLPDSSVIELVSVTQGATTYVQGADYKRTGSGVDWAPVGAEPLAGSTYQATYKFRDSVTPTAFSERTITVADGVAGGDIILAYTYKLPRIDVLGLLPDGSPKYIRGVSAESPVMPSIPFNVLALCEIRYDWMGTPQVVSDGIRTGVVMLSVADMARYWRVIEGHGRLIQLERLKSGVDQRDPAAKKNMFVDPWDSNYYRDEGEAQSAAIGNGIMQLAIEPTFYDVVLDTPITLDWVEEVVVSQSLKTGCEKINPYQNFLPLPGALTLTPAADIWNQTTTQWAADATIEFQRGVQSWGGPLVTQQVEVVSLGSRTEGLPNLRVRNVAFKIAGFFPGENLDALAFDGVDIKPAGVQTADENGEIVGSFNVPANIPAGTKTVRAVGQGGTEAEAFYTGQGTLTVETLRRVTTVNRWVAPSWTTGGGGGGSDGSGGASSLSSDPQAQIFMLPASRQLLGVDFHVCKVGDPANHILVHQVSVENGTPTTELLAEALVPMTAATLGWKGGRYHLPVTTPNDRDHAFVIKTDDGEHSISLAALGGFDVEEQRPVTTHPYPIGPRLSSVNARTWTAHQSEALTFRLVAARYPVTTKTVELGTFDLVHSSDLQVRALAELPSAACSVVFEVERTNGTIYRLLPFQVLQLAEWITETVALRVVLSGTQTMSPILYAPIQLIAGDVLTEATYVSRAFDLNAAERVSAYVKASLPAGSALAMHFDQADDDWHELDLDATETSPDPAWVERKYTKSGLSGPVMRVKLTLTGGASARPRAADFGLGVM